MTFSSVVLLHAFDRLFSVGASRCRCSRSFFSLSFARGVGVSPISVLRHRRLMVLDALTSCCHYSCYVVGHIWRSSKVLVVTKILLQF